MAPAHQRLGPDDAAVAQIDLRLVQQLELPLCIGFAQGLHQRQPAGHVGAHLRLEETDGAAAVALGPCQRQAGRSERIGGVVPAGRHHAGAQARQHIVAVAIAVIRFGQQRQDRRADVADQRGVVDRGQQHRELVAAGAADHGIARGGIAQAAGHLLKDAVALAVTVHVIEGAKVVDAEQDQCAARHGLVLQACFELAQEERAACYPGQRIGVRRRNRASRHRLRPGHHPRPVCDCRHRARSAIPASVTKNWKKSSRVKDEGHMELKQWQRVVDDHGIFTACISAMRNGRPKALCRLASRV